MASEDESQGPDRHHEEREWEANKENFRICYMEKNMTRKEAAEHMKNFFGFDATPRQWERKIKQWEFQKYSSRKERMQQIAQSGRTVYEVSKPGRRPRAQSGNSLQVEDRNLRRFARREVSRSRSRSRSTSFAPPSRSQLDDDFSDDGGPSVVDRTFNINVPDTSMLIPPNAREFNLTATAATGQTDQPMQLHYLHTSTAGRFNESDNGDILLTVDQQKWPSSQPTPIDHQYGGTIAQGQINSYIGNETSHLINNQAVPDPSLGYMIRQAEQPIGFASHGTTAINPTTFHQYDMPTDISMHDTLNADPLMVENQPFVVAPHNSQVPNELNDLGFAAPFEFQLDVVDMDAINNVPIGEFHPLPNNHNNYSNDFSAAGLFDPAGPLQGDMVSLVREYTENVRQLASSRPGDDIDNKLSHEAQMFMLRMSVALENYTKTQQRAVQDVKRITTTLRTQITALKEQNEALQIANNAHAQIDLSSNPLSHRSSLPVQPTHFGNMYQNF